MKTDDLVAVLARSAAPVDARAVGRQFSMTLLVGSLLSVAAMLVFLGPRPDWRIAIELPMFWMKVAFPAAIAVAAFVAVRRLSHPGMRLGGTIAGLAVPVTVVWLMAFSVLSDAPASDRAAMVLGTSWWQCPLIITALSVPAFVAAFRAVKRLAPTRLELTGAVAGLFAGAAAAFTYAFYCVEMQAPFLAVWYVLGMLIPAAVGALVGRKILRW